MTADAELEELRFLTRALRAHLEWQVESGATGLEPASRPPVSVEPAPTLAPAAVPAVPPSAAAAPSPAFVLPSIALPTSAAPWSAPSAQSYERLTVIESTVRTCTSCRLCEQRTQTVFARGMGSSGVCFVGEGPGADEDAQGLPFVGKAGQLLDRMIQAMGLERDEVYVCNVVKCRPPENRKPEAEEMAACMPYLNEQLDLIAPKVIVALGGTAVQGLFGTTEGIMRLRGKWKTLRGIPVMPTLHPAYLLRTPAAKREVWEDLQAVLQKIGRSAPAARR